MNAQEASLAGCWCHSQVLTRARRARVCEARECQTFLHSTGWSRPYTIHNSVILFPCSRPPKFSGHCDNDDYLSDGLDFRLPVEQEELHGVHTGPSASSSCQTTGSVCPYRRRYERSSPCRGTLYV